MSEDKKNKSSKLPLILSGCIVVAIIGSWFLFPSFQQFLKNGYEILSSGDEQRIKQWVNQFGYKGPLIIIGGMIIQMFAIVINVVLLMLVAILAYGPIWGSLIALAGIVAASSIGYLIGRLLKHGIVEKLVGHKNEEKLNKLVEKYGYKAVVIVRLAPFLSNDAISFIAGLLRMNYLKFMGATLLGILPLTILIAWLGQDWERLKSGLIWISVISLVGFIIYIIYEQRKKKRNDKK